MELMAENELKGFETPEQENRYRLLLLAAQTVMSAERISIKGQVIPPESFIKLRTEVALSIMQMDFRAIYGNNDELFNAQLITSALRDSLGLIPKSSEFAEV